MNIHSLTELLDTTEAKDTEYKKGCTKQQLLSRYSIKIDFLSRGCIVNIGCKTIPFEKVEDAITEISRYVNNPEEVEKEYNEKFK